MEKIIKIDFSNSSIEVKKEKENEELIQENKNDIEENKNEEINVEINETTNNENIDNEKEENKKEEEKSEDKINNILEEKIKNNDLSFVSELSENSKKYFKKNNLIVKSINRINNNTEHDNKLLEGYLEKPIEDLKIFQKSKVLRLKTEGDLYLDNLNLLRKTNKTAFLLQEKKDLYDLQLLKKKIQSQTINMNNAMKIKNVQKPNKEVIKDD